MSSVPADPLPIAPTPIGAEPVDPEKVRQALTAAQQYYLQGRTMEAIAAEFRTSRSTISRLLSYARDVGLVDIRVRSPFEAPRMLEHELHARFGVTAHTTTVPDDVGDIERLDLVARQAANVVGMHIESHMTIGLAWGSTMSAVSRHLVRKRTAGTRLVQLNGSGNTRTTGLVYASEILGRFGAAFGAQVQQFPVPAFFDDPTTKQAMWRERSTKRILDMQRQMDAVVFSVGAPGSSVPSHVYTGGYLDPEDLATLARDGVVGDVATVFYRADGSHTGIALNQRATGPSLELLADVKRRICIVSGTSKIDSLRGALAAGLVSDLVIDEPSARALLTRADESLV